MNSVFEELDKLYEENNEYPTLLDLIRCSTIIAIVDDVHDFTHADAESLAAQFNYEDEVDFEEDYEPVATVPSPLANRSADKFIVPKSEVREVINKIINNNIILVTNEDTSNGAKNVRFMNDLRLSEADVKELIRQLNTGDYSYSAPSRNVYRAGNILTFFITKKNFVLSDGRTFENLCVYIKVDATNEGRVTAVSFHHGSGSLNHPYEN